MIAASKPHQRIALIRRVIPVLEVQLSEPFCSTKREFSSFPPRTHHHHSQRPTTVPTTSTTSLPQEKEHFSTRADFKSKRSPDHLEALLGAAVISSSSSTSSTSSSLENVDDASLRARAIDLNMKQAIDANLKNVFDKILILIQHGEAGIEDDDEEKQGHASVPSLTARGIGQVLNLSRQTAHYCNAETKFTPNLIVVSPSRVSVQTAMLTFPDHVPGAVQEVPWVCHDGCMVPTTTKTMDDLSSMFEGGDESISRVASQGGCDTETTDSSQKTDDFLGWIAEQRERVVVVSSHDTWLQSFCGSTLQSFHKNNNRPGTTTSSLHLNSSFQPGEMRIVGVLFNH